MTSFDHHNYWHSSNFGKLILNKPHSIFSFLKNLFLQCIKLGDTPDTSRANPVSAYSLAHPQLTKECIRSAVNNTFSPGLMPRPIYNMAPLIFKPIYFPWHGPIHKGTVKKIRLKSASVLWKKVRSRRKFVL